MKALFPFSLLLKMFFQTKSCNLEKHLRRTHKNEYEQLLLLKADTKPDLKTDETDSDREAETEEGESRSKKIKLEANKQLDDKLEQASPYGSLHIELVSEALTYLFSADKSKRRSPIYNFFSLTRDSNYMQCHYCSMKISVSSELSIISTIITKHTL